MGVGAVDAEGQLVKIGRAHDQRAGRTQSCDHRRIAFLYPGFDRPGARGQWITAHRHEILHAHRHARERPDIFTALEAMVQAMGLFHCQRRIHGDEGIEVAMRFDASEEQFGDLHHR